MIRLISIKPGLLKWQKKKQLKITKKKSNKNRMGEVVEMANKIGNQAWVDKPKSWRGLTQFKQPRFWPTLFARWTGPTLCEIMDQLN
jgi:hypothetical protein